MQVDGYSITLHPYPGVRRALYPHQAVILDEWGNYEAFLLLTKTGSGKTAAAALPFLLRAKEPDFREGAVFVYPTNALIEDQERSIRDLAEAEGVVIASLTPETAHAQYGAEQVILVRVDADRLEAFAKAFSFRKRDGGLDKGRALAEVLRLDKPKIVLINPDILYLIYTLAYRHSAESVATLQAYQTLVFDEFHLYGGVELAHALFLIHLARALHTFRRVLLLSATPDAQTREWIERLLSPYVIDANTVTARPSTGQRQVAHPITLQFVNRATDLVETAGAQILALRETLVALRAQSTSPEYIPGVVILNSVVHAIELEDWLVAHGFAREEIASVRGLVSRAARDVRGKTLVVGTPAIEVGIDFRCDYLIFEAGDAAGFMQRFGRVGRHQPGTAYLLEGSRVAGSLAQHTAISRNDLEQQVYMLYETADARPWFVGTEMGVFTVFVQAKALLRRAETHYSSPEHVAAISAWLDEVLDDYAARLGLERKLLQVRKRYERLAKGNPREQWIRDYEAIDTFRTSLPSVEVYDKDEAERRGSRLAKYTVDVYTLVRKAHQFRYNEKTGNMVVSGGWEKPHQVYFMQQFTDDDCGSIKTTADYPDMVLFREGHKTSASYSLVKPKPHVFIVLPKDEMRRHTDWRMAIFDCGRHIVAFDGDALLLREIWLRQRTDVQ